MRNLFHTAAAFFLCAACILPLCACRAEGDSFVEFSLSEAFYVDGSAISAAEHRALEKDIAALLAEIEEQISPERSGSDVARINAAAAGEPIVVGEHTAALLTLGLSLAEGTGGAFSPALYALSDLWGFSPRYEGRYGVSRPSPSEEAVAAALADSEYASLSWDGETLVKARGGTQVDFGGIAKGYMTDAAVRLIGERYAGKTVQGTLTVMSDSVLLGEKSGSALGYTAGIENPRAAVTEGAGASQALFAVGLSDVSVSTSADNYRFYVCDETIYKHILNPSAGAPSQNGVISVTVFVPNAVPNAGAAADALSTAGFCMPLTEALAFYAAQAEALGVGAVVIAADWRYYVVGEYTVVGRTEYDGMAGSEGYFSEEVFTRADPADARDAVEPADREREYIARMEEGQACA